MVNAEDETGRTIRTRTKELIAQFKRSEKSNPLIKHHDNYHAELSPAFQLEILNTFKDPLTRQADEGGVQPIFLKHVLI